MNAPCASSRREDAGGISNVKGSLFSTLPVLQRPDAHRLPKNAAEVGRRGETGLLGHAADAQLCRFQKLLCRLDAAGVDVVHDGLPLSLIHI